MTGRQANMLFMLITLLLVIAAVAGVYHLFWIADDWIERVIVFFAYSTGIYFVFMLAAFGLGGLGNNLDRAERKWSSRDIPPEGS